MMGPVADEDDWLFDELEMAASTSKGRGEFALLLQR
jgi:hypothetical protein